MLIQLAIPADVDCGAKFSRDNTYGQLHPMADPQQTQLSLDFGAGTLCAGGQKTVLAPKSIRERPKKTTWKSSSHSGSLILMEHMRE